LISCPAFSANCLLAVGEVVGALVGKCVGLLVGL
jgi:hypothetical protein